MAEDPGSVPNFHLITHTACNSSSKGSTSFLANADTGLTRDMYTYTQALTKKSKKLIFLKFTGIIYNPTLWLVFKKKL